MEYAKNKLNETGVWFFAIAAIVLGPALFFREPGYYGQAVGVVLVLGGAYLVLNLLLSSVQKVSVYRDRLELNYYLRTESIPYSAIRDIRLVERVRSWRGSQRTVDSIEMDIDSGRTVRLGANFGGFIRPDTRKMYSEIRRHLDAAGS